MKKWLKTALILTLTAGLAACSGQSSPAAGTGGSSAGQQAVDAQAGSGNEKTKLSLILDWYPNAVHSFLYAAQEQGYFAEENLEVEFRMPSDSNDPLKLVAAGQADLGISYLTQIVTARAEGIPVVSVGALVRHPLNIIMTRQDSGLDSPEKLTGKSIGYSSVTVDEAFVRTVVKEAGGDPSQLAFVDIGFDIVPALTGKKVDAVVGGYLNHEKLILEKHGVPVNVFSLETYGVPDFYELVLATSDETLQEKKEAIAAFLRAAAKGQAYVQENPREALDLLLANQEQEFPLEADIEEKSLEILIPMMDAKDQPFGSQNAEVWQQMIDWMKGEGVIQTDVKVEEVMQDLTR